MWQSVDRIGELTALEARLAQCLQEQAALREEERGERLSNFRRKYWKKKRIAFAVFLRSSSSCGYFEMKKNGKALKRFQERR